ncbi:MAG: Phytochrome-like protein cph2 [Betaproteobacteria bacterium ADurb.Bin341]|nr:MAG: Phytochrome-like protein cph2 [Betaproteobacteria bacterium ADurb.Bin341]
MSNNDKPEAAAGDLLQFAEDTAGEQKPQPAAAFASDAPPWRILIVDDDKDVHKATEYTLQGVAILDRPLQFLHAYSSAEAIGLLMRETNIAVILLDVVMESENAGLAAVDVIRGELGLTNPRIVLRTGQPGYAPEIETIRRYDINDYKTKNELTRVKLYTTLTAAIRSYDQLCRLEAGRRGLEHIIAASNQFISETGVREFSSGVIRQIAAFIGVEPEGLVCAQSEEGDKPEDCVVIAATGQFSLFNGKKLLEIGDRRIMDTLLQCFSKKKNLIEEKDIALFFPGRNAHNFAAFINSRQPPRDVDQRLLEVFCANVSICGDNVNLVEQLRQLAYYDILLKLPNRSYFVEAVDQRMASMKNRAHLTVALLDVDQFSEISDVFGHRYGDQLLFAIARRLESHFSEKCLLARISNDTFGIFGESSLVSPEAFAPFFNASYEIEDVERPITMTAGLVKVDWNDDSNGSTLLKDAFIAVKHAKENGQGQYAWYSPEIATATRERTRLLQDLRFAFTQDRLYVVYQPLIDLATGKAVAVEALMRWRAVDGRLISPENFIPIAEHSGLIIMLGAWILRMALNALRRLHEAGHRDFRMAVNVSTNQFRQAGFLSMIDKALEEYAIPPQLLELEITESIAAMGFNYVEETLSALRQRSISVAIDDFGTGYSSLSYLNRLPANRLKIDRSFITAISDGSSESSIPEMIVQLGHQLNMKVIAEGVETEQQRALLQGMGCDEIQGFLYARPMPLEDLLAWLKLNS